MKLARVSIILFAASVFYLSSPGSVLAFFGSSLDCNSALLETTRGKKLIQDWGNPGVPGSVYAVRNTKKDIEKTNEDSCILQRTWNTEGVVSFRQDVQMTYFSNPNKAVSGMRALQSSEPALFTILSSSDTRYSGSIYKQGVYQEVLNGAMGYKVEGPLYSRTVIATGNCLIQAKSEFYGTFVYADSNEYKTTWVEPQRAETEGFVDGLSNHAAVRSFCGGKGALKSSPTPQPPGITQAPSGSPINLIDTWIQDTFGALDIQTISHPSERKPVISEKIEPPKSITPEYTNFVGIINRQGDNRAQVLLPGATEFTELGMGDVPPGSIIKSRDDQVVIFPEPKGGIVVVESDSEFTVPQEQQKPSIEVQKGTIEVKVEKSPPEQQAQPHEVHTEFMDLVVIGTHFWVSHEPGKQTTVGVYEGTVQVTPRGSKTATPVSPNGNKPGVIVVSQKISPIKFAVVGLLAVGIIAAVLWVFRKK